MTATKTFSLPARLLGSLALPNACERCFWIDAHVKPPYTPMPGIFSSIDSFSKQILRVYQQKHGTIPPWYADVPPTAEPIEGLHWRSFGATILKVPGASLYVHGMPDEILETPSGLLIIDYKTAKYDPAKVDALFSLYEIQLNAYAYIAANISKGKHEKLPQKVYRLALLYYSPLTDANEKHLRDPEGFEMEFEPHWVEVEPDETKLHTIAKRALDILSQPEPPKPAPECDKCAYREKLLSTLRGTQPVDIDDELPF
jgi:hypothetical protein